MGFLKILLLLLFGGSRYVIDIGGHILLVVHASNKKRNSILGYV
jgi:hypothetical protein